MIPTCWDISASRSMYCRINIEGECIRRSSCSIAFPNQYTKQQKDHITIACQKRPIVRCEERTRRRLRNAIRLCAAVSVNAGAKVYATAHFRNHRRFCASTVKSNVLVPECRSCFSCQGALHRASLEPSVARGLLVSYFTG